MQLHLLTLTFKLSLLYTTKLYLNSTQDQQSHMSKIQLTSVCQFCVWHISINDIHNIKAFPYQYLP